jgi:DNA polymerase-1
MVTVLVDGKNTMYRHNFTSSLMDPEGNKVSGVHGMFKEMSMIIRNLEPSNLVVCWDIGKSRERLKLYPEYKGHRPTKEKDPEFFENLQFQISEMQAIIKNLPVKQIGVDGVEADDIIGFLCKQLPGKKIVFSNDSDFLQLVDKDTSLFLASKKKLITAENINEWLGYDAKFYKVWKAMVGDSSDNIKGIPGIGEKTAIKIIKGEKKVALDKEIINRNLKLITIGHLLSKEDKLAIVNKYKSERAKKPNSLVVRAIFKKLGFQYYLLNFGQVVAGYRRFNGSFQ